MWMADNKSLISVNFVDQFIGVCVAVLQLGNIYSLISGLI